MSRNFNISPTESNPLPTPPSLPVAVSAMSLQDTKSQIVMGTPPRSPSLLTGHQFHYPVSSIQSPTYDTLTPRSFFPSKDNSVRTDKIAINSSLPPRCKIICTMGPSCQSVEKMKALVMAGMNVVRMNFSHGEHSYHLTTISNIRQVMAETRRIVAILLDTKGPEIRSGKIAEGEVLLKKGQTFTFTTDPTYFDKGNGEKVYIDYKNLPKVIEPGKHILIDDGLIDTVVQSINGDDVIVKVVNNGMLGSQKGCNVANVAIDLPAVTEKDVADITFGVQNGIDFIAASFVRKASDVLEIRKLLSRLSNGSNVKIISKIENQEGLDNFDSILEASDGIMVARGDLGVEIPIEQVCLAQKMIIRKCNLAGKFVITATQMLESMIKNPSPTRAEASDVANAVLDGTDCVMLSGETAKGKYPIESVQMMADICREAESNLSHATISAMIRDEIKHGAVSITEAIASSAVRATFELRASIIIVLTETGSTARLVSKYRPAAPIITVTSSEQTARQSLVSRGLFPVLVGSMIGTDSLINRVLLACIKLGMCKQGDLAVVTSGSREAVAGQTNDLKVVQVQV